jgi:uncharacterized MAPEG superfamily protein|tara:strand:- start:644 stop:1057 length:414 start_codon:yes stop_codon:yes gene_type:complete
MPVRVRVYKVINIQIGEIMVNLIAGTALLYFIQLLLPNILKSNGDQAKRADKAVKNLMESLPVFFTVAILSVVMEIDENMSLACYWLVSRVLYALIYVSGIGMKTAAGASSKILQPLRSIVWVASAILLIIMTTNLI